MRHHPSSDCVAKAPSLRSFHMARHSHWHNIQITKGKADAKRAASFTKLAREITVAAREKGGDPEMNARLRVAIDRAREASMPKDNIERAIQRGTGEGDDGQLETLTYEAYGPGGTALVIECVTDSRNRTANDIKHLLTKHGGSLAATGSVTYLFDRFASFHVDIPLALDRESRELALIEAGAERLNEHDQQMEILGQPAAFGSLSEALGALGMVLKEAEFVWYPKTTVEVTDEQGKLVAELLEALEANDDVSRVFSNVH